MNLYQFRNCNCDRGSSFDESVIFSWCRFLLTIPPSVGYEQNPLSLYFCYDLEGSSKRLSKCIAQVYESEVFVVPLFLAYVSHSNETLWCIGFIGISVSIY